MTESDTTSCPFPKDDSTPCDRCGRFGALEVNGQHLCEDCFALCGSCCPEFEEKEDASTAEMDGRCSGQISPK